MRLSTLALLCAVFSCHATTTSQPQVYAITSPNAALSRYATFSFGLTNEPPAGYGHVARSLEVEHRMRTVVLGALQQKGYVQDSAKPDFIVKYASGTREAEGQSAGYIDDPPSSVQESLSIDVYDAATLNQVWHGLALTEIDRAKIDDRLLRLSVQAVLATFPARSSASSPSPLGSPAEMQAEPMDRVRLERQ
jgi:hypothetical protein